MHEQTSCCDKAANEQLPIAISFWTIWIVFSHHLVESVLDKVLSVNIIWGELTHALNWYSPGVWGHAIEFHWQTSMLPTVQHLAFHRNWDQTLACLWQAKGRKSSDVAPATKAQLPGNCWPGHYYPTGRQVPATRRHQMSQSTQRHLENYRMWHESEAVVIITEVNM